MSDAQKRFDKRLERHADEFYDAPVKSTFKWVFLGIIALSVIGIGGTYLATVGNVVTAPARVLNKTLDTNNIIHNYEWFYDVNAQYQARTAQIQSYAGEMTRAADAGERSRLRTEVGAMQQSCRDLATQYNANSQKMNREIFKGWSLPGELEITTCGLKVGE